jgi:hypothetical protein
MKPIYLLIYLLFCFSCKKEPSLVIPAVPLVPIVGTDWKLVFEDDFDSDLSKWKIWNSGAFNNELQLYRPQQLSITNGILNISAKREVVTGYMSPFDTTPKAFEYVSGRMETANEYGPTNADNESEYRFIAKIKLPKGNGINIKVIFFMGLRQIPPLQKMWTPKNFITCQLTLQRIFTRMN